MEHHEQFIYIQLDLFYKDIDKHIKIFLFRNQNNNKKVWQFYNKFNYEKNNHSNI